MSRFPQIKITREDINRHSNENSSYQQLDRPSNQNSSYPQVDRPSNQISSYQQVDRPSYDKKMIELEEEKKDNINQEIGRKKIKQLIDTVSKPFIITRDMINTVIFISTKEIASLKIRYETLRSDLPQYSNYIFGPQYLGEDRWMLTITEYPGNKIPDNMLNRVLSLSHEQVLSLLIQPKEYKMWRSHDMVSKKYPGYIFIYHSYNDGIYNIEIKKIDTSREINKLDTNSIWKNKYLKYKNKYLQLRDTLKLHDNESAHS